MHDLRCCGRCGEPKALDDFAWRRIHKGQRDNYCRPCRAAYKQEHYKANKARYVAQARAIKDALRIERGQMILDYLLDHPCADCGEVDPIVLEFDHLSDKEFDISQGHVDHSWEKVLAEIAKCEVVCANCHRRRTVSRKPTIRARLMMAGDET